MYILYTYIYIFTRRCTHTHTIHMYYNICNICIYIYMCICIRNILTVCTYIHRNMPACWVMNWPRTLLLPRQKPTGLTTRIVRAKDDGKTSGVQLFQRLRNNLIIRCVHHPDHYKPMPQYRMLLEIHNLFRGFRSNQLPRSEFGQDAYQLQEKGGNKTPEFFCWNGLVTSTYVTYLIGWQLMYISPAGTGMQKQRCLALCV